jgi:DNA-binding transcriptional LysR family regulator
MKLASRIAAVLLGDSTAYGNERVSAPSRLAAIRGLEYHLFHSLIETMAIVAKTAGTTGAAGDTAASAAVERVPGAGEHGLRDLTSLRIFARVVELQSFSEVARRSGVTPATVSKHVSSLEAAVRARLVNRTTRRLFITDAGQRLYEHCVRVLRELDEAESELAEIKGEPAGSLHVTAPLMLAIRHLSPRLPEFMLRHPKVMLDIDVSIEKVDLFQERIDVALRIADTVDPGLVAFRLAPYRRVFCAAPAYLAHYGTPQTPDELGAHNCLISRGATLNSTWPIQRGGTMDSVRVSGNFVANNGELVRHAALGGLGILMVARWMVDDDLRQGRLVEILAEYAPTNRAIYAVLPRQGSLTPKVRAFVGR